MSGAIGPPHVVIVGGGFAGLYAARALRDAPVRVTLIDRRNHHLFFPLLYQVATAGLNPSDIAAPIRRVLRRHARATVLLGEAVGVDTGARTLVMTDGRIGYDYLIVAAGSVPSWFGHEDWPASAPALMSLEDALETRRRLLLCYEEAEREPDPIRQAEWLTIVVVGGGPTGVEMSGAVAEMARHALAADFRRIDPRRTRVILIEGQDRVLPSMPAVLSIKARRSLERLGVEVRTGTCVTAVSPDGVTLGDDRIATRCVVWAAGVTASPLGRSLATPLDRTGRVKVQPDLSVPGHPEVFVAGDLASVEDRGRPVPGLAPAAIQQGRHAARNIVRDLRGLPRRPFRYRDRGTLATIGRASAVADFGWTRLSGYAAWLAWLLVHIYFLVGFRNRLLVMFQWAWAYVTWERGARLVTGAPPWRAVRIGVLALALLAGPAAAPGPGPGDDETRLLELMNRERRSGRMPALSWDARLARLARDHAADMRSAGRISHRSTADGADFSGRLARSGYRARAAAENVAFDRDVERAHRGLMASPGHRGNILNPDLTSVGIGILPDAGGSSIYVVEDFATPIVDLTDAEAGRRARSALRRARLDRKLGELEEDGALSRRLERALQRMIAADSVETPTGLDYGPGWLFTYTAMDPSELPDGAGAKIRRAGGYALAVRYARTRSYPFGVYWAILVLRRAP